MFVISRYALLHGTLGKRSTSVHRSRGELPDGGDNGSRPELADHFLQMQRRERQRQEEVCFITPHLLVNESPRAKQYLSLSSAYKLMALLW